MQNRAAGYSCVRDLWLRTGLSPRIIARLADADAFSSLGLSRRQALWAAKALGRVGDRDDDLPLFRVAAALPQAPAQVSVPREPAVRLPPMLLTAQELLVRGGIPSREQIRAHLSGNYCRCTGYHAIVDAVEAVAQARSGAKG